MNSSDQKKELGARSSRKPWGCAFAFLGTIALLWLVLFTVLGVGVALWNRRIRPVSPAVQISPTTAHAVTPTPSATPTQELLPSKGPSPEITIGPPLPVLPGTPTPTFIPLPSITIEFPTPAPRIDSRILSAEQGRNLQKAEATPLPPTRLLLPVLCAIWFLLLGGFLFAQWLSVRSHPSSESSNKTKSP